MLKPKPNEIRKPTKTISGITPLAVMLPPRKCNHGACLYCPNLNVPQSYTPKSPVVMRAMRVDYDAYKQVIARIKAFEAMNHPTDKIELIIMGGTFLEYPKKFQDEFIKGLYNGLNNKKSQRDDSGEPSNTLKDAQKLNETSKHRCVALCVETRPDVCSEFIDRMRGWGVTRVELGVQIIDDKIYKKVKRGHLVKDVVNATEDLKNAGFKIGYHIMPGLPGSDFKKDLKLFRKLFSDQRFKPDQLKIYPCQVIPGSELEEIYWKGKYKPYTKEQTEKILLEMLKVVPRYCRVMRVMREIPPDYLVAGTTKIDLRKDIEEELRKNRAKLKEIRYREIGFVLRDKRKLDLNLNLHHGRIPSRGTRTSHDAPRRCENFSEAPNQVGLKEDFRKKSLLRAKITKYKASKGTEYFLEIVNKNDILFGLLRLRIFDKSAIIREIHVYGQSIKLGEKSKLGQQHKGIGKLLIKQAEKIVKEKKIKKLKIISGVGVREYYKKLGYVLEESYMVKEL